MGYTTDFEGEFAIDPPLTPAQTAYLEKFAATRRMRRDPNEAAKIADPLREAVGLPLGTEAEYFVGGAGYAGQDHDVSVLDYNSEPSTQPGLWCKWEPNQDGSSLRWNGVEKFYSYVEWLEYIVANFLEPWGREISGAVSWQGEQQDDFGLITAGAAGVHALRGLRATDNLRDVF